MQCSLLTTVFTKSRGRIEPASLPERGQTVTATPLSIFLRGLSDVEAKRVKALIRAAPGKEGGMNTEAEVSTRHCDINKNTHKKKPQRWMMVRMTTVEAHFALRLLDRAADHAYYSSVNLLLTC